jgi:hypothetical protein
MSLSSLRPFPTVRSMVRAVSVALLAAACNSDAATSNTGGGGGIPVPMIDVSIPAAVAIRQGASATLAVTIARTSYTGAVFVTRSGLPAGVSAPVISSTSTNTLSIPLQADTTAALGPATVTVVAQGVDVASVTRTFVLTVSAR